MKEYIERAAVHDLVRSLPKYQMFNYDRTKSLIGISPDDVDFGVDKMPAADVAPVRRAAKAESTISKTGLMCTACFSDVDADACFCKYCGARMDEKADHDKDLL